MTLGSVLSNALTSLQNAQQALALTSNNVANANTAGYTRKNHQQEPVVLGNRAAGVRSEAAVRIVDEFLTNEVRAQQSETSRSTIVTDQYEALQASLFGAPGEQGRGVQGKITALAQILETAANAPEKSSMISSVVTAAGDLAREISSADTRLQAIRADMDQRAASTVVDINADVAAIHDVNVEIARAGLTAELGDQRDRLLTKLAEKIDFTTYDIGKGKIGINVRGGPALLDNSPRVLDYSRATTVGADTVFGPITIYAQEQLDRATGEPLAGEIGKPLVTGGLRAVLPAELQTGTPADEALTIQSSFTGGRLRGLLDMRDTVLPGLADQVTELAEIARFTLNAAHNNAVGQPPPSSLTGTRVVGDTFDDANRSGTAYLAVIDRATGDTFQTISIDVTAGRDGVVAQINGDLGGLGTAALDADGKLGIALAADYGIAFAEGDSSIAFTDDTGHDRAYGLAHFFGMNDLLVARLGRPGALSVREDIVADPSRLGVSTLEVSGGPPPEATLGGIGDGTGLQALAAAFETRVESVQRGQLRVRATTLSGYASDVIALVATNAANARATNLVDTALKEGLETRQAGISGVNIDEELANLVRYQQSYTVSARIISITNELYDELFSIKR